MDGRVEGHEGFSLRSLEALTCNQGNVFEENWCGDETHEEDPNHADFYVPGRLLTEVPPLSNGYLGRELNERELLSFPSLIRGRGT